MSIVLDLLRGVVHVELTTSTEPRPVEDPELVHSGQADDL